ncbi:hypothetical protein EMPS_06993 [Entomortierella parvispora]|uniref:Uncharacterized protein n=1 Tax=Entomortierella parvispora TaxID=205924 RepID=A0A9P3LY94_9FUNG|nr:hypothetical protein EMPS_06993 [Entomortierella parvispora]
MAADPLLLLFPKEQLSPLEDSYSMAILAKSKASIEGLPNTAAYAPPKPPTTLQSDDDVEVKSGLNDGVLSNKNTHDDSQSGTPSSTEGSTLRESKSASPDTRKNGKEKPASTPIKLSPDQYLSLSSGPACNPVNQTTPLHIKVSPSSMQGGDPLPNSSPKGHQKKQPEAYLPPVLTGETTEEMTLSTAANGVTGSGSGQGPKKDDSMAVEYLPFDSQPLWDLVNQCKEKSKLDLQTICRDLDALNTEIQFVLSDFLTMRFAEIEQMLQSGQINIAQMEHEQAEMQSQMASFLNAIKSAFSFFGHDPERQTE